VAKAGTSRSNGTNGVTSRDVAKAAEVSQALVSRAFTGKGRIAPETRERILRVANEIGWRPNALAASMVTGDAPLVAVITTRLSFEWRAQVLSHLLRAFEACRLKPLLFYAQSDDEVDRLLGETICWRTRGVIVTAGTVTIERAEAILARGQFLAALNRPANHKDAFAVATDNIAGGARAARLFVSEGRRRLLTLAGPEGGWANTLRTRGFVEAAREFGREPLVWPTPTMSIEAGKACAGAFLELPASEAPDAVFSTNDAMAIGFLDGLRRSRTRVPRDLSLIGFDNLAASTWDPYQLTTFEQPIDAMVDGVLAYIDAHQRGIPTPDPGVGARREDGGLLLHTPKIIKRSTTLEE